MPMLECMNCGSLQFSDVGRTCPQCGSSRGFMEEDTEYQDWLADNS